MGEALFGLGILIATIGHLWLLSWIFRASVFWGIVAAFVPLVSLAIVFRNWSEAKIPFSLHVGGVLIAILSVAASA